MFAIEVMFAIGTPTRSPKLRGKSPGWQKGKKRNKKLRCPIVKKGQGTFESKNKTNKFKKLP
ncbi:hypothetical protein [Moorena sp. SIO3A2]|uniref:hypothetical protein n=1 Tax=Moorena sp. SIO3A2 TaxID=2607841 RepID=UPI00257D7B5C|nr:hypothetical protein [Moorena sp. SIO3A2]